MDVPPDAPSASYAAAQACYIDILSRVPAQWSQVREAENFCKVLCTHLRAVALRYTRTDLIIRRAVLAGGQESFGITAYLAAYGPTDEEALQRLAQALAAFADAILAM
jgi:hypothetical protein